MNLPQAGDPTRAATWLGPVAALVLTAVYGCGDNGNPCGSAGHLPQAWSLAGDGVSIEVDRSPYAVRVLDGDGNVVLASADGAEDGYGAVGVTTGDVEYGTFTSPGYFTFDAFLDPWRDQFRVVAAEEHADHLLVTLSGRNTCIDVDHQVRKHTLRVEAHIHGRDDAIEPRAWSVGFQSPSDEAFLGFGERFNTTNQRGVNVFSWPEEGGVGTGEGDAPGPDNPFPSGQAMTYYPVPFFLSTNGYGFWLDTTYRSEFELGSVRDDAWRGWHVGPTLAYEVYVRASRDDPAWPYQIIDDFTATVGRPMTPPPWALGPRRRIGRGSTVEGKPEIQAMRDDDLAITAVDDAMHFYPSGGQLGIEDDLKSWIGDAEALGYRVNGYYNSFVDSRPESNIAEWAQEGVAMGNFLQEPDGSFPDLWIITGSDVPPLYLVDFTNPAATAWYQSSFSWALDLGYAGWMYDFGEYVPPSVLGFDGTTGEALHNLYPVLYARAVHDALERGDTQGDWLAFMRSGYTGSSAYVPMVWSGDPAASFERSDGLPSMIPAALNLGISGAPNSGGDIGGFHCTADGEEAADEELITRWIELGSMMVNMQDQNACVGGGVKASIWTAPAAKQAWHTYARLHTRLFPYLYTLARYATETGAPIMRQLFLDHPDQPELAGVDDAYYLGDALLVAPVVERGARDKTVPLPTGSYLDWNTGEVVTGGGEVTLDAPLDRLPLLIRENHLVPLLDPTIDTLADEDSADVVGRGDVDDVYDVVGYVTAGGDARFTLYDGDELRATLGADVAAPSLDEAASESELATCDGCYLMEDLGTGVTRLRISTSASSVSAGGLTLQASSDRRVRWDLYLPVP